MFKNVPAASFGVASPDQDESDDNISLTSTVSGHDPDQEFLVENILAEEQFKGKMYYLVEWTGFPLHDSTWEAESNLGSELKAMWEEDKAKHATGELEPFDVQKYYDARKQKEKGKKMRHRQRNLKRKRLGLPLTEPLLDEDSSDEEAAEEQPQIEGSVSEPASASRSQNQQKRFEGSPTSGSVAAGSAGTQGEARRPSIGRHEPQTEAPLSTNSRKQTAPPQTTGYQGTARTSRKASTNTAPQPKPRPRISIPTTGAPASKPPRKTLTAKKSTIQPTGNIFTGGRMRKPRPALTDAMADATKEPKLFDRHRYRRLAQLRSRDKEDMAPDPSTMQLFDLRSGQAISRRGSSGSILSPTQVSPQIMSPDASPFGPPQTSALMSPTSTTTGSEAAPPRRKRKSVRFLEGDEEQPALVQEPEMMDLDPPMLPPQQRPSTLPIHSTQNFDKKLVFGQSSVEATFIGLPSVSRNQHPWLADFLETETLAFTHACFAKTTGFKLGSLVAELLASGTIIAQGDEPALERVAQHLTGGLIALYYGQAQYNVLVYPTKCEEWKEALQESLKGALPLDQEPTSPSGATLGYIMFASWGDCKSVLPPLAPSRESTLDNKISKPEARKEDSRSARETMMKRLFDFDFNKLLPTMSRPPAIPSFFLAIPNSRRDVELVLFQWLRASNPKCHIFASHQPGGWDAFRSRVEYSPGVVIIHETLAWSLRRFPNLSKYLITRNDEYWCFSEPIHGLPMYPSISVPESLVPPGEMRLTRLFPYRTAIFLTPSFLVSEPTRSLEFLKWFSKYRARNFGFRLIAAHNIHEFMAELADERYSARQELWKSSDDMLPEMKANLSGLSREDCDCRYAAAALAEDLHMARMLEAGPFAHDEDNSSLVYADESIDPNDEQSLVNWFGWWSTLRADQFRKFHVIGSSPTIKLHGCERGERRVLIPTYSEDTINDPDAYLEVVQERNDQVEASEREVNDADARRRALIYRSDGPGIEQGRWSFRSDIIQMENTDCFADYLDPLNNLDGFRTQWTLYKFPVSWLDMQMATHFGDFSIKFARILDWFNFTFPFGPCYRKNGTGIGGPKFGYNTYLGFFYTIDKEWDPDDPPPAKPLERHPWIAAYRPVNPHKKPYSRCELVIWDPAARTRYPNGRAPAEQDLIYMQRQLIQFVRENGDAKNNGTWLDQVWFGGWDWPADCDSRYPLDVTLKYLRQILGNIRTFLPAPEQVMEAKGYRRVALGPSSASARSPATASSSNADSALFVDHHPVDTHMEMDVDMDTNTPDPEGPSKLDPSTRIIFHPPRGHTDNTDNSNGGGGGRSRCVNRLHEEARLARARNGAGATHMRYRFPPTMDWYKEQQAEGRGFGHVNVASWENVFNALRIGDGAAQGHGHGHGQRPRSGEGSSSKDRRESVGSGSGSGVGSVLGGVRDGEGVGGA